MKILLSCLLLFMLLLQNGTAQQERKFIQCVFSNMEKPSQAKELDAFIQTQSGVFMIRSNFNSRKFFLIYESDSDINLDLVATWFEKYDLEVKCIREGIHGIDTVIDQKLDCE